MKKKYRDCSKKGNFQVVEQYSTTQGKKKSIIHKEKLEHLHVATVGNPAMHMPTLLGGLPGMEALATSMMKKEMEKIDMPDVHEFLDILTASGVKLWACKLAMDMFHYKKEDMYDDIDGVITVGDFYKQGSGLGTHMLFI